jgi:hypothetical protein
MAITTLDGAIAGMQIPQTIYKIGGTQEASGHYSHFYSSGVPGAAAAPTPGVAGAALTTYAGQIPFTNPVSGNSYLARLAVSASLPSTFYLCDRLWHNSGLSATSASAQTVNSVAWPARDANGSTNGEGILVGVEHSVLGGSGTPNLTLQYTNSAGTASRNTPSLVALTTPQVGTFEVFALQAEDTGIRSIQAGYTASATRTSGTFHLVAFRILATIHTPVANVGAAVDALTSGFPRLYDNTVPFLVNVTASSTAVTAQGQMIVTQG